MVKKQEWEGNWFQRVYWYWTCDFAKLMPPWEPPPPGDPGWLPSGTTLGPP